MDRRQFNAFAGQTLIALVLGTSITEHSCTKPDCVRCNREHLTFAMSKYTQG